QCDSVRGRNRKFYRAAERGLRRPSSGPGGRAVRSAADQFAPWLPGRVRHRGIVHMAGGRHLQHGGLLTGREPRQKRDLPAGKLERVVMHVRVFHVDLAETGDLVPDASLAEQTECAVVGNIVIECELSAGKQAYGCVWIADRSKSASDRSGEIGADELVSNRCRAGSDKMQAVVTHGRALLSSNPPVRGGSLELIPSVDQMFRPYAAGGRQSYTQS